jgi:hypothetical protein
MAEHSHLPQKRRARGFEHSGEFSWFIDSPRAGRRSAFIHLLGSAELCEWKHLGNKLHPR